MAQSNVKLANARKNWTPHQGGDLSAIVHFDGVMRLKITLVEEGGISGEGNEMFKITHETDEPELLKTINITEPIGGVIKYLPYTGVMQTRKGPVPMEENIMQLLVSAGRTEEEVAKMRDEGMELSAAALNKSLTNPAKNANTDQPKNVVFAKVSHQILDSGDIASSVESYLTPESYAKLVKSPIGRRKMEPKVNEKKAKKGLKPAGHAASNGTAETSDF